MGGKCNNVSYDGIGVLYEGRKGGRGVTVLAALFIITYTALAGPLLTFLFFLLRTGGTADDRLNRRPVCSYEEKTVFKGFLLIRGRLSMNKQHALKKLKKLPFFKFL